MIRCASVDGPDGLWSSSIPVTNRVEADAAVERIVADGFDCVKVYDELRPEALAAVAQAARRVEIPLVGHVPRRVDFGSAGLDDAQHLRGVPPAAPDGALPPPAPDWWRGFQDMDAVAVSERIAEALWQDMAMTPTLAAQSQLLIARDAERFVARAELALLPPWYARGMWHPVDGISAIRRVPPAERGWLDQAFPKMQSVVRRMHGAGVRVHTGTDSGAPGIVPGAALHEELRLLVEAGLSAEQALAASMVSSAAALRVPRLGSLAPGSPADLVLFSRDPTQDLAHLDSIVAVVSQGRIYSRDVLDAQLRRYQERYAELGPRVVVPAMARALVAALLMLAPDTEEDAVSPSSPRS